MFETGRAPYPVERTLTVSGILEACLTSRIQDHQRLETPQIAVRYRAPASPSEPMPERTLPRPATQNLSALPPRLRSRQDSANLRFRDEVPAKSAGGRW